MTLEQKVKSLERRYTTLYNRYYAMFVRRTGIEPKHKRFLKRLEKVSKNSEEIRKASIIAARRPEGKRPVWLTPAEFTKFRWWLRQDFRR